VKRKSSRNAKNGETSEERGRSIGGDLRDEMYREHGPLLTGMPLAKALGYRSTAAMRFALAHRRLPIRVFQIAGRRGNYAFTNDVATWLLSLGQTRSMATSEANLEAEGAAGLVTAAG
jgi:hypothetical protein